MSDAQFFIILGVLFYIADSAKPDTVTKILTVTMFVVSVFMPV